VRAGEREKQRIGESVQRRNGEGVDSGTGLALRRGEAERKDLNRC
jgi:hypothetical protein